MREKVIMLVVLICVILVALLAIFGLKIGNFQILSVSQLIAKNEQVNNEIDEVTRITSDEYPKAIQELEATGETLKIQKEKYEQLSGFTSEEEQVYETEKYDIGYLWTVVGNYATKNNTSLVMDIKKTTGTDLYDLYFTVQGTYVHISQFITAIENDSDLSFRVYNFKLVPGSDNVNLKATFTVKDVNIDDSTLIENTSTIDLGLNTSTGDTNNNTTTDQNTAVED